MMDKPHKIVYEGTIALLLSLCIFMGYKIEQLEKTNLMKVKSKYYKPLDDRLTIKSSTIDDFIVSLSSKGL